MDEKFKKRDLVYCPNCISFGTECNMPEDHYELPCDFFVDKRRIHADNEDE